MRLVVLPAGNSRFWRHFASRFGWAFHYERELRVDSMAPIPAVNESGMVRSFVFDVSVHNLVLNAIRQCDQLQSSLAGDVVSADDRCGHVFEVLRLFIAGLLQDVVSEHSSIANFALMHVHRWLLCRQALCFHPLLVRVVHRLTKILLNSVIPEIGGES